MLAGSKDPREAGLQSHSCGAVRERLWVDWTDTESCDLGYANIAEGFVRRSNKEFVQFLFVAMSSAAEVQNHLYVAMDQKYLSQEEFAVIYSQADKTARIISGLITYLKTNQSSWTSTRKTKETKKTRETR